jgi:hypothetical protein
MCSHDKYACCCYVVQDWNCKPIKSFGFSCLVYRRWGKSEMVDSGEEWRQKKRWLQLQKQPHCWYKTLWLHFCLTFSVLDKCSDDILKEATSCCSYSVANLRLILLITYEAALADVVYRMSPNSEVWGFISWFQSVAAVKSHWLKSMFFHSFSLKIFPWRMRECIHFYAVGQI